MDDFRRIFRAFLTLAAAALAVGIVQGRAHGQTPPPVYTHPVYYQRTAPVYYQTVPAPPPQANPQPVAAPVVVGAAALADPYGFTAWLNATRARYGLAAVSYDPGLAAWAAANNAEQLRRGMGHWVMGAARRQNSGTGAFSDMGPMWMNSTLHRAALLDPAIRRIGIAGAGPYWTFSAN
jgi:uncharacterized protein YkwD